MSSLDGLHVEVAVALVLKHGGISAVGQGTRVSVAETCQVVLISTKGLCDGSKKRSEYMEEGEDGR